MSGHRVMRVASTLLRAGVAAAAEAASQTAPAPSPAPPPCPRSQPEGVSRSPHTAAPSSAAVCPVSLANPV